MTLIFVATGPDLDLRMGINSYCGSLLEAKDKDDYTILGDVYRDTKIIELDFGLVTFDNVLVAMLSIFQCITLEGWTKMMYFLSDAYFPVFTHIYFIVLVIVCSFFILNLTVAILLDKYAESENQDRRHLSKTLELIDAGKEAGLPSEVIMFIIDQDITTIRKKKANLLNSKGPSESSLFGTSLSSKLYNNLYANFINSEISIPQNSYYKYKITRWSYYFTMHPLFNTVILLIIIMNTVMLAFDKYPEPPKDQQNIFYVFNIVFTVIFSLEVIAKL